MLSDGLVFLGSANVNLVQKRKELLKPDLPKNMQGLCREEVEFTGTELFGDDLNAAIKKVSELNKVSKDFKGLSKSGFNYHKSYFNYQNNSYGSRSRGRPFRGRGRPMRRYAPYPNSNRGGRFNSGRKLNRGGPSRQ